MHSRHYLRAGDFAYRHGPDAASLDEFVPDWSPADRVVLVAPDPGRDLVALSGLVLALTRAFYDRPAARRADFFDYPSHFVVGGEPGAEPRLLGPREQRPWIQAWCALDVWPNTHHAVADPGAEALLQAVFMLEPTRLVWPADVAVPEHYAPPENAVSPNQSDMTGLLRNRLRQLLLWSRDGGASEWTIELTGGACRLADEAEKRLPANARPARADPARARFRTVAVDKFL